MTNLYQPRLRPLKLRRRTRGNKPGFFVFHIERLTMPLFIKRLICRFKGHDFYEYGIYDHSHEIIETAGDCQRCGFDTHESLKGH